MKTNRSSLRVMAVVALSVTCLSLAKPAYAQTGKPLKNQDVVQMIKAGFNEQTVIKAIEANKADFDVSPQALLALKNKGVSQKIIQAMLSRSAAEEKGAQTTPASAPAANPNDPMSPHPPGIYWEPSENHSAPMVQIKSTTYSKGKVSGLFGEAMSMGISKAKWKIVVSGARANLHIAENTTDFWLYFANTGSGFSSGPSSPADFVLVKLEKHRSDRQLVVGKAGTFGASSGVPSKYIIVVQSKQMAPGIYEVRPAKPLKPGEYAFLPASQNVGLLSAGGKLFDFEVEKSH